MLEAGQPLDQRFEDFLRDVVDGVRPRHEPPDPSPNQRIVEVAESFPRLVILVELQDAEVEKANGGVSIAAMEETCGGTPSEDFPGENFPLHSKHRCCVPIRGFDHGIVIGNELMDTNRTGGHHIISPRSRELPGPTGLELRSTKADRWCRVQLLNERLGHPISTSSKNCQPRLWPIARHGASRSDDTDARLEVDWSANTGPPLES